MVRQKKWNNQGGSGRGDNYRKPKESLPNIPSFEKLPESNTISFRLIKPRNPKPDYGQFGDEFWTNWELLDDPSTDISDYKELDEDAVYDNLELSEIRDTIREVSSDADNPDRLYASKTKSKDLFPSAAYKEYEIIVKYKKLILTILSGQAYACRNNLNSPFLDFSLVIRSSEAIQLGENPGGTLNIIQLLGTTIDPAFALYNWVLDKIKIVTDNAGENVDPILQKLPRSGLSLPSTSFAWNGDTYNLFNGSGKEPTQICLHAINDVLKFEPSTPKNAAWKWSVLSAGDPLPLCVGIIPIVSIALAPGSADELEAGSGFSFVLRISIDNQIDEDLDVLYQVISSIDPSKYTIVGVGIDIDNNPIVTIPANTDYADISIEPLENPTETENKTIVFNLEESSNDLYLLDVDTVKLTVTPQPQTIPVISFVTGTITNTPSAASYSFTVSVTPPFANNLYNIIIQRQDTINVTFISNNVSVVINSANTITIPVGSNQSAFNVNIGPLSNWRITRLRSTFTLVADSVPGVGAVSKNEGTDFNYGVKSIDITP